MNYDNPLLFNLLEYNIKTKGFKFNSKYHIYYFEHNNKKTTIELDVIHGDTDEIPLNFQKQYASSMKVSREFFYDYATCVRSKNDYVKYLLSRFPEILN